MKNLSKIESQLLNSLLLDALESYNYRYIKDYIDFVGGRVCKYDSDLPPILAEITMKELHGKSLLKLVAIGEYGLEIYVISPSYCEYLISQGIGTTHKLKKLVEQN